jgi:hypothetical protein
VPQPQPSPQTRAGGVSFFFHAAKAAPSLAPNVSPLDSVAPTAPLHPHLRLRPIPIPLCHAPASVLTPSLPACRVSAPPSPLRLRLCPLCRHPQPLRPRLPVPCVITAGPAPSVNASAPTPALIEGGLCVLCRVPCPSVPLPPSTPPSPAHCICTPPPCTCVCITPTVLRHCPLRLRAYLRCPHLTSFAPNASGAPDGFVLCTFC